MLTELCRFFLLLLLLLPLLSSRHSSLPRLRPRPLLCSTLARLCSALVSSLLSCLPRLRLSLVARDFNIMITNREYVEKRFRLKEVLMGHISLKRGFVEKRGSFIVLSDL